VTLSSGLLTTKGVEGTCDFNEVVIRIKIKNKLIFIFYY
jgi:hypothetical protein